MKRPLIHQANRLFDLGSYQDARSLYLRIHHSWTGPKAVRESAGIMANICEARLADLCAQRNKKITHESVHGDEVKVGAIGPDNAQKGLLRDVETVMWACSHHNKWRSSAFLLASGSLRDICSEYVPKGSVYQGFPMRMASDGSRIRLNDWLQQIDVLVLPEVIDARLLDRAVSSGIKRVVFIPNLEWAFLDGEDHGLNAWAKLVRSHWPFVLPIARTKSIQQRLASLEIKSILVPWSIPDEVLEPEFDSHTSRVPEKARLKVLFNGGGLGFRDRRGGDIFLEALRTMPRLSGSIDVVFKSNMKAKMPSGLLARQDVNLTLLDEFFENREEIEALYRWADVVVYPSRFEGFGLGLLEALHNGCFVLATDGFPMSELVPDPAMLIDADMVGYVRQAYRYEPSAADLAKKISKIAARPAAYRIDYSSALVVRQNRFRQRLCRLIRLASKA